MRKIQKIPFIFAISVALVRAQDPNLIDVTSLDQLDAMRHDLDGDGAVEVTTDASPSGNIDALEPLSAYATQFPGGAYYTRDSGTDTEVADAAVAAVASTTYVYKLPAPASGSYTGYELTEHLDFNGTKWGSDCTSACLEADGGEAGTDAAVGWNPIGDLTNPFLGTFDGNGYTISNIFIDRNTTNVGLFASIGPDGEVRNLGLEGGSVRGQATGGLGGTVAPLAGALAGTVRACYATTNAEGAHTSNIYVSGLVGFVQNGTLASCYATGNATSTSTTGYSRCGGLVAHLQSQNLGPVSNCYATGNANADGTNATAGGLIGASNNGSVTACYATGNANATATGTATAGGLIGSGNATVTASYFDYKASNRPSTDEYAQSTYALQSETSYTGLFEAWDDQEQWVMDGPEHYIWSLCGDTEYPKLNVDFDGDGTPSVGEFGAQGPCTSSFARIIDLETAGTAQDTKIMGLETGQTEHGTKLTELETAGTAQDTKITALETAKTELETAGAAQDTKITALETAKTELETAGAAQDTKITALETAKTELETGQTAQDTKITALETAKTELETAQAAIQAKIAAFEAALTAAGVDIPDPPTGGTPGGGTPGTTPPTGGTPGTTPPSTTTIYNVPAPSGTPQAYPNPAQHTLLFANLTPGSTYVYKIYTAAGSFLTSGTVQDDKAINISTLESGQYLLTLQNNEREVLRTSLLIE